jgi:hypothetical protein
LQNGHAMNVKVAQEMQDFLHLRLARAMTGLGSVKPNQGHRSLVFHCISSVDDHAIVARLSGNWPVAQSVDHHIGHLFSSFPHPCRKEDTLFLIYKHTEIPPDGLVAARGLLGAHSKKSNRDVLVMRTAENRA